RGRSPGLRGWGRPRRGGRAAARGGGPGGGRRGGGGGGGGWAGGGGGGGGSGGGRIEATATTAWFGFKDDVVIRVTPRGADSAVVDMRSKSRVGKSDVGANAARIGDYFAALKQAAR